MFSKPSVIRSSITNSIVLICDVQEIFRNKIWNYDQVIQTSKSLIQISKSLDVPIVGTTQYAKRFGPLVPELEWGNDEIVLDKTKFSMMTSEMEKYLHEPKQIGRDSIVLCGIETHVCILQTCIDFLESGYQVHLILDGISSQRPYDRQVALQKMKDMGAQITTFESLAFQWMEDSKHPQFKHISSILKEHNQNIPSMQWMEHKL